MPNDTTKKPLRPEIVAAVDRVFASTIIYDPNARNKNLEYLLANSRMLTAEEMLEFEKKSKR
jgi:hypothetical protein